MTEQERQQGFYNAIRAAEMTYGLTLQAEVKVEQLGQAVLMKPGLTIVALEGWLPPEQTSKPTRPPKQVSVPIAKQRPKEKRQRKPSKAAQNGHNNGAYVAPPLTNKQVENDLP